jgi:hypothetical protein
MGTRVNGVDLDAGTSVTISTATPQPLGTAAAGSTGEASDAGHVHALPAAVAIGTAGADAARPAASTGLIGSLYTATDTHTRYLCESDGAGRARWCVAGRHQYEGRDTTCARMGGTRSATSDTSTVASTILSGAIVFALGTLPGDARILVSISAPGAGWQVEIGRDATRRGRVGIYAFGFGTPDVLFDGAVAAADSALHCIAWTWDGTTVRWSWDGSAVATVSHVSGTLTSATVPVRYAANHTLPYAPDGDLAAVKLWSTAVGDAGLEAASLAGVAGRITDPAGATCVLDWHASRHAEGFASQPCVRGTAQRMTWSAAPPMVIR